MFALSLGSSAAFTCLVKDPVAVGPSDAQYQTKPFVDGSKIFIGGVVSQYTGALENMTSPIIDSSTGKRAIIGVLAQMTTSDAEAAVESASKAWNNGQGEWPQMKLEDRIAAIKKVMESIHVRRQEIANVLMWEIAKTVDDALLEVGKFTRHCTFHADPLLSFIILIVY